MQILHRFAGPLQQYEVAIAYPDRPRPDHCPQCEAHGPLAGHGFHSRTLVDAAFDAVIRVRRCRCRSCQRTISLLPQFALPCFHIDVSVIALSLTARLLEGHTLVAAAAVAAPPSMPYQRGQFWVRRFRRLATHCWSWITKASSPCPQPRNAVSVRAERKAQQRPWRPHRSRLSGTR